MSHSDHDHSHGDEPTPLAGGSWMLDPERSEVSFVSRTMWGAVAVRGRFSRYEGRLDLDASPAIELVIEADSIDTGNPKRDEHLRSADFFGVAQHPQVRFSSSEVGAHGDHLHVRGELQAGSGAIVLEPTAHLHEVDGEIEIDAVARVSLRELGMSRGPGQMIRSKAWLSVRGRLIPARVS